MSNPTKAQTSGLNIKQLALTGLMTAVLCILGPLSLNIPISPVPISLGFLGIYFICSVLGMKLGTLSVITYILLGLAGLPVFTALPAAQESFSAPPAAISSAMSSWPCSAASPWTGERENSCLPWAA